MTRRKTTRVPYATTADEAPKCSREPSTLADGINRDVLRALDLMIVAEAEIAKAEGSKKKGKLQHAFKVLYPTELLHLDEQVYRHHVREILARINAGDDLRPGTCAEVMAALMSASLKAPLGPTPAALYERIFVAAFGKSVPGASAREAYDGAADELLHEMRRKLTRSERFLP